MTCATWMGQGLVMYRDMFDHKGPLVYCFEWLGLLGGFSGLFYLTLAWALLAANAMYATCRLLSSQRAAEGAAAALVALMLLMPSLNSPEMVAMPFIGLAMWTLLRPLKEGRQATTSEVFVAALMVAILALIKPNLAAAPGLLALPQIVALIRRFNATRLLHYAGATLAAMAIVAIPFCIIMLNVNALRQYIDVCWTFNFEYSAQASSGTRVALFIHNFVVKVLPLWLIVAYVVWRDWHTRSATLWLLALTLVTVALTAGLTYAPHRLHLLPAFGCFALFVARALDTIPLSPTLWRTACALAASTFLAFQAVRVARHPGLDPDLTALAQWLNQNTRPDDGILDDVPEEGNIRPKIYIFAHRYCPTRYFYQNKIFDIRPSMRDEMNADLRNSTPKIIIVPADTSTFHIDVAPDILERYSSAATFGGSNVLQLTQ